jgi:mono/diheme cytochrome c family protein
VAIAIFVIEDEYVSGWKFTLPILIAVTGFIAMPQEKVQSVTGNTVLKASDLSGVEMYRAYCASCHGIDGQGAGPAAEALRKAPPDLTQLAKHNNGHLPDFRILRIIDGYEIRAAHGSRDMPIWGDYFRRKQRDEEIVAVREHNLVEYIRSIQKR